MKYIRVLAHYRSTLSAERIIHTKTGLFLFYIFWCGEFSIVNINFEWITIRIDFHRKNGTISKRWNAESESLGGNRRLEQLKTDMCAQISLMLQKGREREAVAKEKGKATEWAKGKRDDEEEGMKWGEERRS